jgi:hypothetical protein
LAYTPQLAAKQLLLLLALTLPALAIATVVGNVVQFIFVALASAAALVLLTGGITPLPFLWTPLDDVRRNVVFALIAAGAITITIVQYRRRRTILSRATGLFVAVAAGIVYLYLPRGTAASMRCNTAQPITINFDRSARWPADHKMYSPPNRITAAVPLDISGVDDSALALLDPVSFEIDPPGGTPVRAQWGSRLKPLDPEAYTVWFGFEAGRYWQILQLSPNVFRQVTHVPVAVRGTAILDMHRKLAAHSIPLATRAIVPGVGRCTSYLVDSRPTDPMLGVSCESPAEIPRPTRVTLVDGFGHTWKQMLSDSMTFVPYPRNTSLSPVNRLDTFFHLAPPDTTKRAGAQWLVPNDVLPNSKLVISGEPETGCRLVRYEIPNVVLADYVVQPSR